MEIDGFRMGLLGLKAICVPLLRQVREDAKDGPPRGHEVREGHLHELHAHARVAHLDAAVRIVGDQDGEEPQAQDAYAKRPKSYRQ